MQPHQQLHHQLQQLEPLQQLQQTENEDFFTEENAPTVAETDATDDTPTQTQTQAQAEAAEQKEQKEQEADALTKDELARLDRKQANASPNYADDEENTSVVRISREASERVSKIHRKTLYYLLLITAH